MTHHWPDSQECLSTYVPTLGRNLARPVTLVGLSDFLPCNTQKLGDRLLGRAGALCRAEALSRFLFKKDAYLEVSLQNWPGLRFR
jgi:hypothetical protein